MAYIPIDKDFDIRTLEILIKGTNKEIEDLIKRNTSRFYDTHLVAHAENLDALNHLIKEYKQQLREKIGITVKRLASTDNGHNLSNVEAADIFLRTIKAVDAALAKVDANDFFTGDLQPLIEDELLFQINESRTHLAMFISQYSSELNTNTDNYLKKYISTMIRHSYIFEKEKQKYSLLVFLSFYEAYVKRVVGLALLAFAKSNKRELVAQMKSGNDDESAQTKEILHFAESMSVPATKSCYFSELQRWFKGEITEFIERFLMIQVDEEHRVHLQKNTLIDKKMLRQDKCSSIVEPPVIISSPPLIDKFFLISDSRYMIM